MTCHDVRELFSALIDERLSREERADVYGHLTTCPECRRELTALEQTVGLVRRSVSVRAPVGFVDRVVTAVRPTPWYVRAARAAFLPWPVKLPLEAAALLLVGGLAVLLFRGIKEEQRATRYEATPPAVAERRLEDKRAEPEASAAKSTTAPSAVPQAPPPMSAPADAQPGVASSDRSAAKDAPASVPRRADDAGTAESRLERAQAPPPAAERDALAKETYGAARGAPPVAQSAPESRDKSVTAKLEARPPDVVARLAAPDPGTAARAVAALAARLAGSEAARRTVGDTVLVEVVIPRERYADFTREVARLGDYRTDSEPASLPDPVRVDVHLAR